MLAVSCLLLEELTMTFIQAWSLKRRVAAAAISVVGIAGAVAVVLPVWAQSTQTRVIQVPAKGVPDTLIPVEQRKDAPDFTLNDTQGKPVTLSGYKGKVVLLDFWATWCPACQSEIPWYVEFSKTYQDKGLVVVGVSMDKDGLKVVQPYMQQKQMSYTVVLGDDNLVLPFGMKTIPMTMLIDRDGKIAVAHTGVVDKDNFEGHIQELLKQGPAAQ
jgi:peroxiredoxin